MVDGEVNVAIHSIDGPLLTTQSFNGSRGDNQNTVNLPALADGTYKLIVMFGDEKQSHKFVVH